MSLVNSKLLLPLVILSLALPVCAQDVQMRLGDVKDTRTTGQFFAGLDVELKLSGDTLEDAKSMKLTIESATDDTGRNLIDSGKMRDGFEAIGSYGQKNMVTLKLKNPARKAATVKEITGSIELFVPKQDPGSSAVIESFQAKTNAPFEAPGLQKANVKVIVWNKAQFDAIRAKKKESQSAKSLGGALSEAFGEALGGLFGFGALNDNDFAMQVEDADSKVVEIEFQDAAGKKIETNGRSSTTQNKVQTIVYNFRNKMPENAKLVVYLSSPKALLKVPLALKDVPLP